MSSICAPVLAEKFPAVAVDIFCGELEFTRHLPPGLAVAVEYLSENHLYDLTLQQLADKLGANAAHLASLFRAQLDTSFEALEAQLQLLYALSLLEKRPAMAIAALACQTGFADGDELETAMQRYTGLNLTQIIEGITASRNGNA